MKHPASHHHALLLTAAALAGLAAHAVRAQQPPEAGYFAPAETLHIEAWLPPAPAQDSLANAADVQAIYATRALIGMPRGDEAHADDVLTPAETVAPRFAYLMGITLDRKNAPRLMQMMELATNDALALMRPVKKNVGSGGRRRPFIEYPDIPKCPLLYPTLGTSGSYPSGHGAVGWLWGAILAELAPQFADALLARGIAFGDSRVVCGFHYPSDVAAGRLTAAALLQRLHADPKFLKDLGEARKELAAALAKAGAARYH